MISFLLYAGLLGALAGLVSTVKPLRFLAITNRPTAAWVLAAGLGLAVLAEALPAPLRRSPGTRQIDRFMPAYHFNEVHSLDIQAPADRVFAAIRAVPPGEIRWLRTLFWIRSLPARLAGKPDSPERYTRPIFEGNPESGSALLVEEPGREVVLGLVGQFWKPAGGARTRIDGPESFLAFDRAGFAKATLNFVIEDEGGGRCRLTTETRVFTPDPATRRVFAAYWRLIYPGSSLLRTTWLAAVKRRAEGATRP